MDRRVSKDDQDISSVFPKAMNTAKKRKIEVLSNPPIGKATSSHQFVSMCKNTAINDNKTLQTSNEPVARGS